MKLLLYSSLLNILCLLASCSQNTGESSSTTLATQLSADVTKGKQNIQEYQALHDSCFELIRSIKMTSAAQGETGIQKGRPLVDVLMPFFLGFEKHKQITAELEALSNQLSSGQIPEAEVKKIYETQKIAWQSAAEVLPTGAANYQKVKATFLETFPQPLK
ncbi:MAG TPA: hypothetical protein VK168_02310 [Saprospiraceae bacterium]|nr:hypothetical protein [Saprospiraceae bacterium]